MDNEPDCLDANLLALWLDDALPPERRELARRHLDECPACQRLIAAAERARRTEPPLADENPAPPAPPLEKGSSVGRFTILDSIGEGGTARVYAAYDPELDRRVALKLLNPHLRWREGQLADEARAMARLSHPSVVTVYDVGALGDQTFIAMELVAGTTLQRHLSRERLPWRTIVSLFAQAGAGLLAAHEAGIVHGDFKAQNVLVHRDGRVRVSDFGLSRLTRSLPGEEPGSVRSFGGTPAYMAPEQIERGVVGPRSDQFSFFASLFEALHGKRRYAGESTKEILAAMREGKEPVLSRSDVPSRINRVLLRGLERDPERRFPSMKEALAALEPARSRGRAWLIAGAGLALVCALALWTHTHAVRPCPEAATHLAGVWDGAQRTRVGQAFAASGRPYAGEVFAQISSALTRFVTDWSRSYTAACHASLEHARSPDPAAYLRMACLMDRLAEARAKTELLAQADAQLVENADAFVSSLAGPASCEGTSRIAVPLPASGLRASLERARAKLMRIKSLDDAAHYAEALPPAESAVREATAIGWPPLRAEALYLLSEAQMRVGRASEALQSATESALIAEGSGDETMAVKAWIRGAMVESDRLVRYDRAEALEQRAAAAVARAGGDDSLQAAIEDAISDRLSRSGHPQEALEAARRSVALYERANVRDRGYSWALNDEALCFTLLGRYDEAAATFARATEIKRALLGDRHPDVAISRDNRGYVLTMLGRYDEAQVELDTAERIFAEALNPDQQLTAALYDNIGTLALARHDADRALKAFEKALAASDLTSENLQDSAREGLIGLGNSLIALGRPAEAIAHLEQALPRNPETIDALDAGDAYFGLAQALHGAGRGLERVPLLLDVARIAYRRSGTPATRRLAELEAWQAEHLPIVAKGR